MKIVIPSFSEKSNFIALYSNRDFERRAWVSRSVSNEITSRVRSVPANKIELNFLVGQFRSESSLPLSNPGLCVSRYRWPALVISGLRSARVIFSSVIIAGCLYAWRFLQVAPGRTAKERNWISTMRFVHLPFYGIAIGEHGWSARCCGQDKRFLRLLSIVVSPQSRGYVTASTIFAVIFTWSSLTSAILPILPTIIPLIINRFLKTYQRQNTTPLNSCSIQDKNVVSSPKPTRRSWP